MSVTKLQIGIAGALAIAGATGFVVQTRSNDALRQEMANLQQQNQAIASVRTENRRLEKTAAEVAGLRQDDAALARLRDEAAVLQESLRKMAQMNAAKTSAPGAAPANPPARQLSENTRAAFEKLKSMQAAKDFDGMLAALESLIPTVDPTSYDLAMIMDKRAKLYGQKAQFGKAVESWEMALQLSKPYGYFDEKSTAQIHLYVAQFRHQLNPWF